MLIPTIGEYGGCGLAGAGRQKGNHKPSLRCPNKAGSHGWVVTLLTQFTAHFDKKNIEAAARLTYNILHFGFKAIISIPM